MSFTEAELDAMRAADAEIEADFCMTPEEIASARRRDEWATFERVRGARVRAAPKSMDEVERDFQKFLTVRDKDRERKRAYYHTHKQRYSILHSTYYRANRERCLLYAKEYYQTHKDECRKRTNEYRRRRYRTDPDYAQKMRDKSAAYRQRKKQAEGGG